MPARPPSTQPVLRPHAPAPVTSTAPTPTAPTKPGFGEAARPPMPAQAMMPAAPVPDPRSVRTCQPRPRGRGSHAAARGRAEPPPGRRRPSRPPFLPCKNNAGCHRRHPRALLMWSKSLPKSRASSTIAQTGNSPMRFPWPSTTAVPVSRGPAPTLCRATFHCLLLLSQREHFLLLAAGADRGRGHLCLARRPPVPEKRKRVRKKKETGA